MTRLDLPALHVTAELSRDSITLHVGLGETLDTSRGWEIGANDLSIPVTYCSDAPTPEHARVAHRALHELALRRPITNAALAGDDGYASTNADLLVPATRREAAAILGDGFAIMYGWSSAPVYIPDPGF